MKTKGLPRFDVAALRDLVGDKVFERGMSYHRSGQVEILHIDAKRVLAEVSGTEDYRTELVGRGREMGGECTCPAFRDWGYCKHMVAVALEANAATPDDANDTLDTLSRIRSHLKKRGIDALVEMIMEMAERDTVLFSKLDTAASILESDDKTLRARLRKVIDGATRTRGFVEYQEAAGWAAGVDEALDVVAKLVSGERAGLALEFATYAIDQIERATGEIDDSNGECRSLLHRAREIHFEAASTVKPDPVQLARDLFKREVHGNYDTFSGALGLYADLLGNDGGAEYRCLAVKAWEKLPRRGAPKESGEYDESSTLRFRLAEILDFFAERDGDVDARIAIRAHDLSSAWQYMNLAQFCLEQGRAEEALRRAEEGLWIFEDRPDERLVSFVADLLSDLDRADEAEAHLWRTFEKVPSLVLYRRLRSSGGETARDRAIAMLGAKADSKQRTGWYSRADILVSILIEEGMFGAAWAAAHRHGASDATIDTLASVSEATNPHEALEVYAKRVDQFIRNGGNTSYAEAAKLIARMGTLQETEAQTRYVAMLRERHGKKRNFIKLLG